MLRIIGIVLAFVIPGFWLGYVIGAAIERKRMRMMKARIELLGEVFRNESKPLIPQKRLFGDSRDPESIPEKLLKTSIYIGKWRM